MVQVSKFIVPHALQVHFVFRAGGGGGGSSRPGMPETFERIREKSPEQMALKLFGIQKFPFGKCKFLFFKREQSPTLHSHLKWKAQRTVRMKLGLRIHILNKIINIYIYMKYNEVYIENT